MLFRSPNSCGIQYPATQPPPPPPPSLTVSLNQPNPSVPIPNQIEPGVTITGSLVTNYPLTPGDATVTVNLFNANGTEANPNTVGLFIHLPPMVTSPDVSENYTITTIDVSVPTGSNNGSFGFSGSGSLAFTITDSQGNQFSGSAPVAVGTGGGQAQQFLPGVNNNNSGRGGIATMNIPAAP